MKNLQRLVTAAQQDKQEVIDLLETVIAHVRAADAEPGAWAVVIGTNLGGHARVSYRGGSHEVLALASRIAHSANRAIDEGDGR